MEQGGTVDGIRKVVAGNLTRLRGSRGLTLSRLAELAGISKGTLSALEQGNGNPTIVTLWALADALAVSFGALVEGADTSVPDINEGVHVRLLAREDGPPRLESYLLTLEAGAVREAVGHGLRVDERVIVLQGQVRAGELGATRMLAAGVEWTFDGARPHLYATGDGPATLLVMMRYAVAEARA